MKKPPWPVLARLHRLVEDGELHRIEPAIHDAIADRLEAALASGDSDLLREAADAMETALQAMAKAASAEVRAALRGATDADPLLSAVYAVGQTAFAHSFAARALDKRADDRLVNRLTDRRYERYVRALLHRPQSGDELAAETGERKETVSRKLGALAALGIVERRRQGNCVINVLSPAARLHLAHKNIAPLHGPQLAPKVTSVLELRSRDMPDHMRSSPILGVPREAVA